jgi:hypothetical protein
VGTTMKEPDQPFTSRPFAPSPHPLNYEGKPRRVGLEIEFGGISARDGAGMVRKLFGGTIEIEDEHRFHIRDTELGDFVSELDMQYAHRSEENRREAESNLEAKARKILGDVSAVIAPSEIVCPPIDIGSLYRLDELVQKLGESGAKGTSESPFYAFGLQLNPEIASKGAEYIASVLKAYVMLSDWLRAVIKPDLTRKVVSFADPFPRDYAVKIVDTDYWPDIRTLIDDYLDANPTRNRELDMLPLFSWLDEERVGAAVNDPLVNARPAFHYRLPNAHLGETGWGIVADWNRWCVVERLADDKNRLAAMGAAFTENRNRSFAENWALRSTDWLLA